MTAIGSCESTPFFKLFLCLIFPLEYTLATCPKVWDHISLGLLKPTKYDVANARGPARCMRRSLRSRRATQSKVGCKRKPIASGAKSARNWAILSELEPSSKPI